MLWTPWTLCRFPLALALGHVRQANRHALLTMEEKIQKKPGLTRSPCFHFDLHHSHHHGSPSQKRRRRGLVRSSDLLPPPLVGMSLALTVEEDASLGDDVVLLPYKPRRRRRPPVNPFPRILKRDLRRSLPTMYANVVNSGEKALIASFLNDFCLGSVKVVDYIQDSYFCSQWKESSKPWVIAGLRDTIHLLTSRIGSSPDFALTLNHACILQRLRVPGSQVAMKAKIVCSLLHKEFVHFLDTERASHVVPSFVFDALRLSGYLPPQITASQSFQPDSSWTEGNCSEVEIEATIIFSLDSNNHIYRIEMRGDMQIHPDSCS